ncbi:MAG TPA: hypothetical protein VJX66_29700, partial [Amycolatopsis sp.]|nr:hypothetical protein [Amycolatopsis sp.]
MTESAEARISEVPTSAPPFFGLRLALANLGLFTALLTPVLVTLAVRIGEVAPETKEASLGLVTAVGAFVALVA